MNMRLYAHTPTLVVIDPRGLPIRSIALLRSEPDQPLDEQVTYQAYDAAGRLVSQRDPRLALPNLSTIYNLSGQSLSTDSVDAGWRLGLLGQAGQIVEGWDGRGTLRQIEYDSVLRPQAIIEQGQVTERFGYGGSDVFDHNQCNQLIRHDDTAGTRHLPDYGVRGAALIEARHFLQAVDTPHWPQDEAGRDALLESNCLETQWTFNAVGETLRQTDAMGHVQSFKQTVAGQLKAVDLMLAGATQAQALVSDIRYNAFDQVEQETAGNGVVSRSFYDAHDGRLLEIRAGSPTLQNLQYAYDPVGNILQIEEAAQPIRYFANQRTEPINHYRYDTLYQLIEATGREINTGASHGPALPAQQNLPSDPNRISNYTQSYSYDSAGNLLQMRHVGAQGFTRTMGVATNSNRSLPEGEVDADFNEAFDANGNLLQLVRGQTLEWDARNQLHEISTVIRTIRISDQERYIYDGQGRRCRKINSTITSSRTLKNEVRYLPGLEIRTHVSGETLHVITAQAGRNGVRVLHWEAGLPIGIANDQIRYALSDHLGSSTLELDQQGALISQESYYPFGGTSWWAARSVVEAKFKTVRYSGKERDASGLYYYGFRYYAPWLQRWLNPDPAGAAGGLNRYRMVDNSPVCKLDQDGLVPVPYQGIGDKYEQKSQSRNESIVARGREQIAQWKSPDSPTIEQSLELAQLSYEGAISEFKASTPGQDLKQLVSVTMGAESLNHLPSLAEDYTSLSHIVQSYKEGERYNQFAVVTGSMGQAYVTPTDPYKRIFLSDTWFKKHTLGAAFIVSHELTHVLEPENTKDFAYLNPTLTRETRNSLNRKQLNAHLDQLAMSSYRLAEGRENAYIFSRIQDLAQNGLVKKDELMKLLAVNSEQDIQVERLSDPAVRASLLRRNADSVAALGVFLSRKNITSRLQSWGQFHP
ncbi:RHS repeat domain-containing protein [Pseudomonas cichorii]|uniref:RHS repeat domain-containing protein n=1 Tax=Pseudomonas cichorii TaxID=36746 RepID=UPI001C88E340|nr:RHS repeat-associated core domain-containing protein [Pseudomonas cichorii]MBX8498213.1 RHS repeat protein [Pseudomonas cichorii]